MNEKKKRMPNVEKRWRTAQEIIANSISGFFADENGSIYDFSDSLSVSIYKYFFGPFESREEIILARNGEYGTIKDQDQKISLLEKTIEENKKEIMELKNKLYECKEIAKGCGVDLLSKPSAETEAISNLRQKYENLVNLYNQSEDTKLTKQIVELKEKIDDFNLKFYKTSWLSLFTKSNLVAPDEDSITQFEPHFIVTLSELNRFLKNNYSIDLTL